MNSAQHRINTARSFQPCTKRTAANLRLFIEAANDDAYEVQAGFMLLQNLHFRRPWRSQGDVIRAKTTLNGVLVYSTVQKANSAAKGYDISYVHEDHLGSTDSVTSRTATLDTRMLFDPFGSRRQPSGVDADATYLASLQKTTFETTSNGYTGHEQIDSVQLVHMGGRMYDPVLGRFLSTDANIQYPEISQSYNRYSYVLNNPLSMVDPSGEAGESTNEGNQETNTTTTNGTNTNCTGDNCTNEQAGEKVNDAQGAKPTGSDAPTTSTAQKVDWNKVAGKVDAAITMLGVVLDVLTPADPGVETAAGKAAGSAASKAVKEVGPKLEDALKTASKKADDIEKETGSYTNLHQSGRTYDGKGSRERSQASGKRVEKETGDQHVATEWRPAATKRDAFKDESKRLDSNGGASNSGNYNKIESPGKKYRSEDGD